MTADFKNANDLPDYSGAYAICALWLATEGEEGTPLENRFDLSDFSVEAVKKMESECLDFASTCEKSGLDTSTIDDADLGHNFWLSRNGHGTGFWDRDLGKLGDELHAIAEAMGESDVYEGDDGKLHVS